MSIPHKLLLFDLLLISLTLLFAFSFNPFLRSGSLDFLATSRGVSTFLIFLSAFLAWSAAVSLLAYFCRSLSYFGVSLLVTSTVFFAGLTASPNLLVRSLFAFILFIALADFSWHLGRESADRISFSVRKIFLPPLKNLATFILILFSLTFFFPYQEQIRREGFRAPEVLIDRVVDTVGRKIVETIVNQVASSSKLPSKEAVFVEIPEEIWEAGLTDTLEQEFGVRIDRVPQSSADLLSMIKPSIEGKIKAEIENYLEPIAPFLPALISLIIFLSLLPLVNLALYLIFPLLTLIFFLLRASGFTREEVRTAEIVRPVL